jgi:DNA-directed RNA polymerase subunit RPC12/RpoP
MNPIFQVVWSLLGKTKIVCPRCGARLPGESLKRSMECPKCGARVRGRQVRRDRSG